LDSDVLRRHSPANGILGITEQVGSDLAFARGQEVQHLLRGRGRQLFKKRGAIVRGKLVEDLCNLLVAEGVQEPFLIIVAQILKDLGGHGVRENSQKDRLVVSLQVSEDFGNLRGWELAKEFPEVIKIALANQLSKFGLNEVTDHKAILLAELSS
jgi:hypothetical protein